MDRIKKMSEHLSNKISAGEVVDQPASAIKPLKSLLRLEVLGKKVSKSSTMVKEYTNPT